VFPSLSFEKYEPSFDESKLASRARGRLCQEDKRRNVPFLLRTIQENVIQNFSKDQESSLRYGGADHSVIAYYAKAMEEWDESEKNQEDRERSEGKNTI
jgi:hypothetical protein